jgi:hypothetical protein
MVVKTILMFNSINEGEHFPLPSRSHRLIRITSFDVMEERRGVSETKLLSSLVNTESTRTHRRLMVEHSAAYEWFLLLSV